MGLEVSVLAPMGGGFEKALKARWIDRVHLHHLRELKLNDGKKGLLDMIRLLFYSLYVFQFLSLLHRHEFIYINGSRIAPPFALLSCLAPASRWFYHLHLCHSSLEKYFFALVSLLPWTKGIIFASEYIRKDFFQKIPELQSSPQFTVLENCLSAEFSKLPFSDRFIDCGDHLSTATVALIGRVSPEKGHDILPRLARRFPEVTFLIIGRTNPEQEPFLESVLESDLTNLINMGETSRLAHLLEEKRVQFSLVPSRWEEPFGLTAIESMAASCITLVSRKGMLPAIAEKTGALCFSNDFELEQMLGKLLASSGSVLGARAKSMNDRVQKHFGIERFKRGFAALISQATTGLPHPECITPGTAKI
jgi:glycosyltransferase involved in cell wall biosynthesis